MLDATGIHAPQPASSPAAETHPPARYRKVAILGFGGTVKDCPWRDPSWELWGLNGFWRVAKADHGIDIAEERYSLWFDMHDLEYTRAYGKIAGIGDSQEQWLRQPHPFPVLMLDALPEHPAAVRYPVDQLIEHFNRDYFTSGVAYAIAFALAQPDVAEIGLWGIDLVHKTEYTQQRPCAEYWIGRAEERGVRITTHEQSALLKQRHRYGYNQADPLIRDMRDRLVEQAKGLQAAIEKHSAEVDRLQAQMHTDNGALQTVNGMLDRLEVWDRGGRI